MSSVHDRLAALNSLVPGCHHINRIRHALIRTGFIDHLERVENCGPTHYCNTSYCSECRKRHVRNHTRTILKLIEEMYGGDEALARNDIRFVTVLHELCRPDIQDVKDSLGRGKRAFAGLRRSFPGLSLHGRFEFEAVDTEVIFKTNVCPQKSMALQDLNGGSRIVSDRDMILMHSHFLLFVGDNHLELVRDKMLDRFPGRYRVKIDQLHADKSVNENVDKICSYLLKDRYIYNHRFDMSGNGKRTYLRDDVLSFLIRSYMSNDIGISSSLIYSKR